MTSALGEAIVQYPTLRISRLGLCCGSYLYVPAPPCKETLAAYSVRHATTEKPHEPHSHARNNEMRDTPNSVPRCRNPLAPHGLSRNGTRGVHRFGRCDSPSLFPSSTCEAACACLQTTASQAKRWNGAASRLGFGHTLPEGHSHVQRIDGVTRETSRTVAAAPFARGNGAYELSNYTHRNSSRTVPAPCCIRFRAFSVVTVFH